MDVRTWIARQRASHQAADREEAARFRAMTPAQRGEVLDSLCRASMRLLAALPEDEHRCALEFRDPLPQSSLAALARLRAAYAARSRT